MMDKEEIRQRIRKLQKDLQVKKKKLQKIQRVADVKKHVRRKIEEHNTRSTCCIGAQGAVDKNAAPEIPQRKSTVTFQLDVPSDRAIAENDGTDSAMWLQPKEDISTSEHEQKGIPELSGKIELCHHSNVSTSQSLLKENLLQSELKAEMLGPVASPTSTEAQDEVLERKVRSRSSRQREHLRRKRKRSGNDPSSALSSTDDASDVVSVSSQTDKSVQDAPVLVADQADVVPSTPTKSPNADLFDSSEIIPATQYPVGRRHSRQLSPLAESLFRINKSPGHAVRGKCKSPTRVIPYIERKKTAHSDNIGSAHGIPEHVDSSIILEPAILFKASSGNESYKTGVTEVKDKGVLETMWSNSSQNSIKRARKPRKSWTEDLDFSFLDSDLGDIYSHVKSRRRQTRSMTPQMYSTLSLNEPHSVHSAKHGDDKPHSVHTTKHGDDSVHTTKHGDDSVHTTKHGDDKPHSVHTTKHGDDKPHSVHTTKNGDDKPHSVLTTKHGDDKSHSVHTTKHGDDKPHSVHTTKHGDDKPHSVHTTKYGDDKFHSVHTTKHGDDKPHSVLTTKHGDDKPHSVHTAKHSDNDKLLSLHTAKHGDDDDKLYSVHTAKYGGDDTPHSVHTAKHGDDSYQSTGNEKINVSSAKVLDEGAANCDNLNDEIQACISIEGKEALTCQAEIVTGKESSEVVQSQEAVVEESCKIVQKEQTVIYPDKKVDKCDMEASQESEEIICSQFRINSRKCLKDSSDEHSEQHTEPCVHGNLIGSIGVDGSIQTDSEGILDTQFTVPSQLPKRKTRRSEVNILDFSFLDDDTHDMYSHVKSRRRKARSLDTAFLDTGFLNLDSQSQWMDSLLSQKKPELVLPHWSDGLSQSQSGDTNVMDQTSLPFTDVQQYTPGGGSMKSLGFSPEVSRCLFPTFPEYGNKVQHFLLPDPVFGTLKLEKLRISMPKFLGLAGDSLEQSWSDSFKNMTSSVDSSSQSLPVFGSIESLAMSSQTRLAKKRKRGRPRKHLSNEVENNADDSETSVGKSLNPVMRTTRGRTIRSKTTMEEVAEKSMQNSVPTNSSELSSESSSTLQPNSFTSSEPNQRKRGRLRSVRRGRCRGGDSMAYSSNISPPESQQLKAIVHEEEKEVVVAKEHTRGRDTQILESDDHINTVMHPSDQPNITLPEVAMTESANILTLILPGERTVSAIASDSVISNTVALKPGNVENVKCERKRGRSRKWEYSEKHEAVPEMKKRDQGKSTGVAIYPVPSKMKMQSSPRVLTQSRAQSTEESSQMLSDGSFKSLEPSVEQTVNQMGHRTPSVSDQGKYCEAESPLTSGLPVRRFLRDRSNLRPKKCYNKTEQEEVPKYISKVSHYGRLGPSSENKNVVLQEPCQEQVPEPNQQGKCNTDSDFECGTETKYKLLDDKHRELSQRSHSKPSDDSNSSRSQKTGNENVKEVDAIASSQVSLGFDYKVTQSRQNADSLNRSVDHKQLCSSSSDEDFYQVEHVQCIKHPDLDDQVVSLDACSTRIEGSVCDIMVLCKSQSAQLWCQKQDDWVLLYSWVLEKDFDCQKVCLLPSKTMVLFAAVGNCHSSSTAVICGYCDNQTNWQFSIEKTETQLPGHAALCCPINDREVCLSIPTPTGTQTTKHILTSDFKSCMTQLSMEETPYTLNSMVCVDGQSSALLGTATYVAIIWNHDNGLLLKTIPFTTSLMKCLFAASLDGLMFLSVLTSGDYNGNLLAMNPYTEKTLVMHSFEKCPISQDSLIWVQGQAYGEFVIARSDDGAVFVWNIYSGVLLAHCDPNYGTGTITFHRNKALMFCSTQLGVDIYRIM